MKNVKILWKFRKTLDFTASFVETIEEIDKFVEKNQRKQLINAVQVVNTIEFAKNIEIYQQNTVRLVDYHLFYRSFGKDERDRKL